MNGRCLRGLLACGAVATLAGCVAPPKPPLYQWGVLPRQQYDTLLRVGAGAGAEEQIRALQADAEKARGAGAALPPGFRAHLGMLQLQAGNVDEARQSWQAEKLSFPESAPYMNQLLKRLESPAAPAAPASSAKIATPA